MSGGGSTGVCGIVAVGDELLAGAHPDLNSPFLARRLVEEGRRVVRVFVVGDDEAAIAEAVGRAAEGAELVFVSGGLGPTLDDVTRHGVARAVGRELVLDRDAWDEIRAYFERAGREALQSNERQALVPEGATRVPNAFGTAPGFRAAHPSGATVVVLPGPPRELQGVFEAEVAPWLATLGGDGRARAKATRTFLDLPESLFAERVGAWMARDAEPLVGVTVKQGVLTARVVATADTQDAASEAAERRAREIAALFPEQLVGGALEGSLGAHVGAELVRLGLPVTLAESCTGGGVAAAVTDAAGISAVFRRSFVTYANDEKRDVLGVPSEVLELHGAVSEACARAMAEGALERAGARVAVSVTGIAGPTGGTAAKPVGLVWFGVSFVGADGARTTRAVEKRWPDVGRDRVRAWARNKALALLLGAAREAAGG